MGILSFKDSDSLFRKLGAELEKVLKLNWDRPILFFLPEYYSDEIFANVADGALGRNITFSPAFEGHGVKEELSRARSIQKTKFWEKLVRRNCDFFDTGDLNALPFQRAVGIFSSFVRKWTEENPEGLVFAVLNTKSDGAVAGIKPLKGEAKEFERLFCDTKEYVSGYEKNEDGSLERTITITFPLLKKCRSIYVLVTGEANKDVFQKIALDRQMEDLSRFPAYFLREAENTVFFSNIVGG